MICSSGRTSKDAHKADALHINGKHAAPGSESRRSIETSCVGVLRIW